jgi:hypothetical protein
MKLGPLACVAVALASLALTTLATSARAQQPTPAPSSSSAPPTPSASQSAYPEVWSASSAAPPPPPPSTSVRMTLEATQQQQQGDRPSAPAPPKKSPDDSTILHGFRLGYGFVMNYDEPADAFKGKSLKQQADLRSPHHFLIGYEVVYRVVGHSWLNVLLLGNGMIAGLEQSKILPSGNLMIGAELLNSFQIGLGANVTPLKGSEAHAVAAAGWTPKVGTIYTPVHFYFIPDVDGNHRLGVTTGVTF